MRTFITIHQGSEPRGSVPVLATEDPEVVEAVLDAVARRLGVHLGNERPTSPIGLTHAEPELIKPRPPRGARR